jgi:hypothetical protein
MKISSFKGIMCAYLFDIIICWFSKLSRVLGKIQDIIMDLKSDAKMSSEVKEKLLSFIIKVKNHTNASI